MIDNEFDNFVNGKLSNHQAPVPDGLWDKLTDKQFDDFIGTKLKEHAAPVPEGLWDKVSDGNFDQFFSNTLGHITAPVPAGLWDKIADKQFDSFFSDKLQPKTAPVTESIWGGIADKQFDTFISDKIGNYTASVPAGLWEKIQPQEKDERKIVYWFRLPVAASILLAVLLGGSFAAYIWFKPQTGAKKVIEAARKTKTTTAPKLTEQPAVNDSAAPDNNMTNPAPATPPPVQNKTTDNSTVEPGVNSNAPLKAGTENKAAIRLSNTAANSVKKQNPAANTGTGIAQSSNTFQDNNAASHLTTKNNKFNSGNNKSRLQDNNNTTNNNEDPSAQSIIPPVNNNGEITDNSFEYIPPYAQNLLPAATIPFAPPAIAGWRDLSGFELTNSKHASQFKSNVVCPTNRSFNTDWLLEVYASPDFAFKSLSNNTATTQYLQRKDSIEHSQIGFSGGIRLVKPLNDNFLIKTGIQYAQINQSYVYRSENEIKTTTVITQRTIIRAPGDTVLVADTSVLQQIGFKNLTVKNRFRSIDVPLLLGYQFGNGDLKFGVNAGVIFNLSSWYQGSVIDTTLAVVPYSKSTNMLYKSNIGLGLYAGFSITKQLSDDMDIFFEPYFRYNLSNVTSAQSRYNQKFSVGGLSIGLRFNLNK